MNKKIVTIIQIGLVIVLLFTSFKIFNYFKADKDLYDANADYKKLIDSVLPSSSSVTKSEQSYKNEKIDGAKDKLTKEDEESINIINTLKENYENIVARIVVPGTEIDQPVVQGDDNLYYLDHNYMGEYNPFGAVFMDYRNSIEFDDFNTIFYGHNVKTGHIFHDLKNFLDPEFTKNNEYIYLDTLQGRKKYKITAVYVASPYDEYRSPNYDEVEYKKFKKYIESKNVLEKKLPEGDYKILTLSTCSGDTERLVVQAIEM